jgi:hypothetical protein
MALLGNLKGERLARREVFDLGRHRDLLIEI